jgi:hypothetical protein
MYLIEFMYMILSEINWLFENLRILRLLENVDFYLWNYSKSIDKSNSADFSNYVDIPKYTVYIWMSQLPEEARQMFLPNIHHAYDGYHPDI